MILLQTYKRDGSDLHMVHKIGLVEALCGFQFTLKHLDGRQIVVKYPAGKVIEPGEEPSKMMPCTTILYCGFRLLYSVYTDIILYIVCVWWGCCCLMAG